MESESRCQIACVPRFREGDAEVPPESLARKLRLLIRRSLRPEQVRAFKSTTSAMLERIRKALGMARNAPAGGSDPLSAFKAGDRVRIRAFDEIQTTLNPYGQLRGCVFMPEMQPYCGTVQRVFRVVERFVDERDYHVKKARGILLLEGLHCEGTSDYGRCDRACFYFWREEWVERLTEAETQAESR